jgi:predicted transcriptional regulator
MRPPAEFSPAAVSIFDQRVYRAIAAYAWNEPECHPSQETIARDIGCARESVNRAVRRLITAGWLRIKDKRLGRWRNGQRWMHNVYELLAPFAVAATTVKRIVRRSHNTFNKCAQRLANRADHTNHVVGGGGRAGWCSCRWCKPDRGRFTGPSPASVARRRWRPAGPGWREELARRLMRAGRDVNVAYELEDRLAPLPAARAR